MKKFIISFAIALVAVVLTVAVGGWIYYHQLYNAYRSESKQTHVAASGDSLATNSMAHFSDVEISLYGKWTEQLNPMNYRVFTLEDAGEGYYWGKEWCEADNVFEDDLEDHGSGWFRWKVKKNNILFLYQTNLGLTIPSECILLQVEDTILGIQGKFSRSADVLNRVYN